MFGFFWLIPVFHCSCIIMCSKAGLAAIEAPVMHAVLPSCQSIRVMTHPPPLQHCHSPTPSLEGLIHPEASTSYKHTQFHTQTHSHIRSLLSACLSSVSMSPRPPYLLAFPPVADALSQSTKQFWGDIRCSEDKLRHYIKQGNGKVKQTEQHYYSTNKCTSLPDSSVPACPVLCCPLSELCSLICPQTETWYQCLYKL